MTKEQAIAIIENEKECVNRANNCNRDCYNCELVKTDIEILTALDMATKALEQQPISDDCVSRQAVIEYIKACGAELAHDIENESVREDILNMPPVTPTIPTCEDCRYWYSDNGLTGSCYKRLNITRHDYDDYCIDFTKRGNENG